MILKILLSPPNLIKNQEQSFKRNPLLDTRSSLFCRNQLSPLYGHLLPYGLRLLVLLRLFIPPRTLCPTAFCSPRAIFLTAIYSPTAFSFRETLQYDCSMSSKSSTIWSSLLVFMSMTSWSGSSCLLGAAASGLVPAFFSLK